MAEAEKDVFDETVTMIRLVGLKSKWFVESCESQRSGAFRSRLQSFSFPIRVSVARVIERAASALLHPCDEWMPLREVPF